MTASQSLLHTLYAAVALVVASAPVKAQTSAPAARTAGTPPPAAALTDTTAPAPAPATHRWSALALAEVPKPDMRSRLDAGHVVTWKVDVPGSSMPRVHALAEVNAPPEKVWAIVGNCAEYQRTMARIAESKLLRQQGDDVFFCRITVDMPFPFSNLTSTTRDMHTHKDGSHKRSWTLVEGDYSINAGFWAVHPLDGGRRTLAVYSLHAQPNIPMPSGILSAGQYRALPAMMNRLRAQTEPR